MKTVAELRDLSSTALQEELLDIRKKQFNLRLKKVNGDLKQTHQILFLRKAVARIKTILRDKIVGEGHD